jgi:hypothetical protein
MYIFITSPVDGSTVNKSEITVTGTVITQADEVGITVNGILASIYGNQFVVNNVPLVEGSNIIVAKAIDSNGATQEARITITAAPSANYIRLTANIESGIAPLETTLTVDSNLDLTNSYLTYTYPGTTPPEVTAISTEEYKVRMTVEGVYTFTATVTDAQGVTYTDSIAITVLNRNALDALLKGKWEGMKEALVNKDVEKAVSYFTDWTKERYSGIFTALGDRLPQVAQDMQDIRMIYLRNGVAKYRIRRIEAAGEITYYIYFVKDDNGLWKISTF